MLNIVAHSNRYADPVPIQHEVLSQALFQERVCAGLYIMVFCCLGVLRGRLHNNG